MENTIISTDKTRCDIPLIHAFLTRTYWGKGRTPEEVKTTIEASVCFGIYLNGRQVGFARVLSDRVAFAYLLDVFILEAYRGRGLSKKLLPEIMNYPAFKDVGKWMLATEDAHGLYEKFGFGRIETLSG